MTNFGRQRGAVLATSLMMLVVVTLLAISSIQTSTVNLRIAENMRASQEAKSIAQEGINQMYSDIAYYNSPAAQSLTVQDADGNNHTVSVTEPECVDTKTASGYSAKWALAPEDNTWQFTASVTANDGATAAIQTGVKVRMATGSCP